MAALMMGGTSDEKNNPIFHDFMGMSCGGEAPKSGEKRGAEAEASFGGHGLVSASSDLGSERHLFNNFEHFQFQGRKSEICVSELDSRFSRRERSNSDSASMGLSRERMLPAASDSLQNSHLMKVFGKEVVSGRPKRSLDDESLFAMKPPQRPTSTSVIVHAPIGNKPDSGASNWERPMLINAGAMVQYPSHFAHGGTYADKLPSSCTYRESGAGPTLISHVAADEGSRTGMKGAKILNIINSSSGVDERNSLGMFPCRDRQKAVPRNTEPESSNIPSGRNIASTCRQMTIFYDGQAHVFDDVHPNKADVIMALAGSNGGSWSTTYSVKSCSRGQPTSAGVEVAGAAKEKEMGMNSRPSVQRNCSSGFGHVARTTPVANDPPSNLIHGAQQGARNIGLTRPTGQAAERGTERRHMYDGGPRV